jgi:hypothetical protein
MNFPETVVARVTGIAKKRIAETRRSALLVKGTDWLVEDSCVTYSPAGLKKLCQALAIDQAALEWFERPDVPAPAFSETQGSREAQQPAAVTPEPQFPPGAPPATNPPWPELDGHPAAASVATAVDRIQTAQAAALIKVVVTRLAPNTRIVYGRIEARPVIVQVRDNRNFRPGMTLTAQPATGDYFHMHGNCPRWPGRW